MPLRDILKKKDKVEHDVQGASGLPKVDDFTFVRTDTHTEEIIVPPTFDEDNIAAEDAHGAGRPKILSRFRKASNVSARSQNSTNAVDDTPVEAGSSPNGKRRLSQRLHLTPKSRASSHSSIIVPSDLPSISDDFDAPVEEKEAKWEERATILAQESPLPKPEIRVVDEPPQLAVSHLSIEAQGLQTRPSIRQRSASDVKSDETIQEAIQLHESGDLEQSTKMFGRLAENGNVLSQVLYGLALRHGWGCQPDPTRAITYLSAAASNSAAIEEQALKAGMKKGGAAKGELVLAIFELANCFRNGWGVQKDPVAARQYYETAANLGDTDAMSEAAWCYMEGFGGKKDKVSHDISLSRFRLSGSPNGVSFLPQGSSLSVLSR